MTSITVMNALYKILVSSAELKALRNGTVYILARPNNSVKQDFVINCITNNNDDVQQGVYNINAFAKNMVVKVDGRDDSSQPDFDYFDKVGIAIKELFTTRIGNSKQKSIYIEGIGRFELARDTLLPDAGNQHYYNFRINYYSPNI